MSVLLDVGAATVSAIRYAGALIALPIRALSRVLARPREGGRVVRDESMRQIMFTGVEGLDVTVLIALAVGGIITAQTLVFFAGQNSEALLGTALKLLIVRELGPLLTAMIVVARSGAAITVDLGNLVLRGERDLLETMGVDPVRLLVVPRIVGVVVSVVCLGVVFDTFAIIGGYLVSWAILDTPLRGGLFVVQRAIDPADIALGAAKCAIFGLIIATVSISQGLAVGGSTLELPRATRRSIVHTLVACVFVDAIATALAWQWIDR